MIQKTSVTRFIDGAAGGSGSTSKSMGGREAAIGSDAGAPGIWMRVRRELRGFVGADSFDKWIAALVFVAEVDGDILLAAPTPLERDRVRNDHLKAIALHWRRLDSRQRAVRVDAREDIDPHILAMAVSNEDDFDTVEAAPSRSVSISEKVAGETGEEGGLTFDTLVTGASNELAAGLARRISDSEAGLVPVVLFFGPNGCGKTHKLSAIQAARAADKTVVHMSAEEFTLAFVDGVKRKDTSGLRKRVRKARVLMLDDLHLLRPGSLREFFSHLRAITEKGGVVIVTSDAPPSALSQLDTRMRDEIQGGVVVEIERPDFEMRAQIVRAKADLIAQNFPDFVLEDAWIEMLAEQLPASGRSLYGAVRNIFAGTVLMGRPVTRAAVEAAIRLQVGRRGRPKVETIKDIVATQYEITKADLESPDRRRVVSSPRQLAMYLSRKLTTCSYPQIGRMFGGRDHTTVIYAFEKISCLVAKEPRWAEEIALLEQKCLQDPRNGK